MGTVLIAGAGHIGSGIAHLLTSHTKHKVVIIDQDIKHLSTKLLKTRKINAQEVNIKDKKEISKLIQTNSINAVVSCLPYYLNCDIAQLAQDNQIHYFDLTEDIKVSEFVLKLAQGQKQAYVTQCGLAPGFINISANDLMQRFDELDVVKLRCGGLPINASNELKYAFTWSVDGLINEYNQPCLAIDNKRHTYLTPLTNLEHIQIDGLSYEAFNTSGGIGSLTSTYEGKVNILNYKTIRYPGHRDKIKFLLQDLKLGQDTDTLKKILLDAIPHTRDDVVILFISVLGKKKNKLNRESFVTKYYAQEIDSIKYSALQLTTAASASAVISTVLDNSDNYQGHIPQETFTLQQILATPFGQYLEEAGNGKHFKATQTQKRKFWSKLKSKTVG